MPAGQETLRLAYVDAEGRCERCHRDAVVARIECESRSYRLEDTLLHAIDSGSLGYLLAMLRHLRYGSSWAPVRDADQFLRAKRAAESQEAQG